MTDLQILSVQMSCPYHHRILGLYFFRLHIISMWRCGEIHVLFRLFSLALQYSQSVQLDTFSIWPLQQPQQQNCEYCRLLLSGWAAIDYRLSTKTQIWYWVLPLLVSGQLCPPVQTLCKLQSVTRTGMSQVPGPGAELLMGTLLAALLWLGTLDNGHVSSVLNLARIMQSKIFPPTLLLLPCILTLLLNHPPV